MHESLRVLLIEDDADYRRLLHASLAGSQDPFQVESATNLADALSLLDRVKPDVILTDLNLPDSSGYATFARVRGRAGQTPIVVLTAFNDDAAALQASDDGAQDYLVKDLVQPDLIGRHLRMAVRRHARLVTSAQGNAVRQVLAFIGSKGGVGTSTTAINVAAHLCANGQEVLAIEFQPGAGVFPFYLPVRPTAGLDTLLDASPSRITPHEIGRRLMEAVPGLRLLCRIPYPAPSQPVGPEHARAVLGAARELCSCVVIDLPPYIDAGAVEALKLCTSVTLVADREQAAVGCAIAVLEQLRSTLQSPDMIRLALVERSNAEPLISFAELKEQLKMHPSAIIPHVSSGLTMSYLTRTPLVWLEHDQTFGLAIGELAEHLAGTLEAPLDARAARLAHSRDMRPAIPETMYS